MQKLSKREWIAVSVSIVVVAVLFFGADIWNYFAGGPDQTQTADQQAVATSTGATASTTSQITMQNISTVNGLEAYDEQVGTGAVAKSGQTVTVNYVGYLTNGTKFDSSLDRNQPFSFQLGAGQVIQGWDLGVAGMKVGGVRRLVISPELAYGSRAIGPIPANSTLVFEVQLVNVQ